jgi:hypothetical protein
MYVWNGSDNCGKGKLSVSDSIEIDGKIVRDTKVYAVGDKVKIDRDAQKPNIQKGLLTSRDVAKMAKAAAAKAAPKPFPEQPGEQPDAPASDAEE